jgi:hypothetical protein
MTITAIAAGLAVPVWEHFHKPNPPVGAADANDKAPHEPVKSIEENGLLTPNGKIMPKEVYDSLRKALAEGLLRMYGPEQFRNKSLGLNMFLVTIRALSDLGYIDGKSPLEMSVDGDYKILHKSKGENTKSLDALIEKMNRDNAKDGLLKQLGISAPSKGMTI